MLKLGGGILPRVDPVVRNDRSDGTAGLCSSKRSQMALSCFELSFPFVFHVHLRQAVTGGSRRRRGGSHMQSRTSHGNNFVQSGILSTVVS